ncbi:hypothetical protein D3C86_1877450 [compost metagenome]
MQVFKIVFPAEFASLDALVHFLGEVNVNRAIVFRHPFMHAYLHRLLARLIIVILFWLGKGHHYDIRFWISGIHLP